MKVIDLLNDLFDYRELQPDKLPKKIRFNNEEFIFKSNSYYNENDINIMAYVNHTLDLRVEVEIIEEDKEIEIFNVNEEEKDCLILLKATENELKLHRICCNLANKTNELVKAVNELKKGK